MHIAIIGPGNMGSLYGALLARAGYQVTLLGRQGDHLRAIASQGLRFSGGGGSFTVHPATATSPEAVEPADLALITVNGYQTAAAAKSAAACLKPAGAALCLQNGLGHQEVLEAALGPERVMLGLIYHSANLEDAGSVRHTIRGHTVIGELDGARSARLEALEEALEQAGLQPAIAPNLSAALWEKFILNCALNPICAITGLRPADILRVPALDAFQSGVIEEVLALARAMKVQLTQEDPVAAVKRFCEGKFHTVSMVHHLARGKATEIDCMNGHAATHSESLGLPAPRNASLTALIKAMEQRTRLIGSLPA